jgi:hypothetical protein
LFGNNRNCFATSSSHCAAFDVTLTVVVGWFGSVCYKIFGNRNCFGESLEAVKKWAILVIRMAARV